MLFFQMLFIKNIGLRHIAAVIVFKAARALVILTEAFAGNCVQFVMAQRVCTLNCFKTFAPRTRI